MAISIAIDTNLLVLLVVGLTSPDLVSRHKRLREFSQEDFELLKDLASRADQILVTPHILAETSNLASNIAEPYRSQIMRTLQALVEDASEISTPSAQLAVNDSFLKLGLTDTAILDLPFDRCVAWTVDLDLWSEGRRRGLSIENFNHWRDDRG